MPSLQRAQSTPAEIELPDGRTLAFLIRPSARARALWLRWHAEHGLIVTVPRGVARHEVLRVVTEKADWIARRLADAEGLQAELVRLRQAAGERPLELVLPAVAERRAIAYAPAAHRGVRVRARDDGSLLVSGDVADVAACQAALRRWLLRRAAQALAPWLAQVAAETGLAYGALSIKNQRGRWGSCSTSGRISLNCKLLFLPPECVRYVLVHELCHTREHNHSPRYWAWVARFEPQVQAMHRAMREGWRTVPAWV